MCIQHAPDALMDLGAHDLEAQEPYKKTSAPFCQKNISCPLREGASISATRVLRGLRLGSLVFLADVTSANSKGPCAQQ